MSPRSPLGKVEPDDRQANLRRLAEEQGVKPYDPDEWAQCLADDPISDEEWGAYTKAMAEIRNKP